MLNFLQDVANSVTQELWEEQASSACYDPAPLVDDLESASPPWVVMSDKFSILQEELVPLGTGQLSWC